MVPASFDPQPNHLSQGGQYGKLDKTHQHAMLQVEPVVTPENFVEQEKRGEEQHQSNQKQKILTRYHTQIIFALRYTFLQRVKGSWMDWMLKFRRM